MVLCLAPASAISTYLIRQEVFCYSSCGSMSASKGPLRRLSDVVLADLRHYKLHGDALLATYPYMRLENPWILVIFALLGAYL